MNCVYRTVDFHRFISKIDSCWNRQVICQVQMSSLVIIFLEHLCLWRV